MTERELSICEAASRVFLRYGVKRTGMNDIASEAGVARQTLYNIFPNKEAVLLGTIRLFMDRALTQATAELAGTDDLRGQLGIVFEHLVRRPYAMAHATPNAEDIIEGVGGASRKEIAECREGFRSVVLSLVSPSEDKIRSAGMTPQQFADSILNFASAAKHEARDQEHLDELLQCLTAMIVRCAS